MARPSATGCAVHNAGAAGTSIGLRAGHPRNSRETVPSSCARCSPALACSPAIAPCSIFCAIPRDSFSSTASTVSPRSNDLLLRDQFRARQVVAQGDDVKVLYTGPGFAVSTQGRALSGATEGQTVRVVTDSGKTLSGTARAARVVEIKG